MTAGSGSESATLLARDKRFAGIGPARADALVGAAEGLGGLDAALAEPAAQTALAEIAGVPVSVVAQAAARWLGAYEERVRGWLIMLGLSPRQAADAIQEVGHGDPAVCESRVRQDPYLLADAVSGVGFTRADQAARSLGIATGDPRRARAAILYVIGTAARAEGHTRLAVGYAAGLAYALVPEAEVDLTPVAASLVLSGRLHEQDGSVSLSEHYRAEQAVARLARERAADLTPFARLPASLSDEQRTAVLGALSGARLSVITGAAGTGKTFTVTSLADALAACGITVAFAAPTGKAARRLERLLGDGRTASTIHRLLEYSPQAGGFRRTAANPLDADVVVVDESSMADSLLTGRVVAALRPSARLILVGDHHQLPPVGPGSVLRDLVRLGACPVGRLVTIRRQDDVLAQNATRVLHGHWPRRHPDWIFHREPGSLREILATLEGIFGVWLANYGRDALLRTQVITPRRQKAPLTAGVVNAALQRIAQVVLYGRADVEPGRIVLGDKVIQTKNDYQIGLMNGDQAIVAAIRPDDALVLQTQNGREVLVPKKRRHRLALAYALTVHSVQGDEADEVAVALDTSAGPLLTRPLLYTAVTRARHRLHYVGPTRALRMALARTDASRRATWLPGLLVGQTERRA